MIKFVLMIFLLLGCASTETTTHLTISLNRLLVKRLIDTTKDLTKETEVEVSGKAINCTGEWCQFPLSQKKKVKVDGEEKKEEGAAGQVQISRKDLKGLLMMMDQSVGKQSKITGKQGEVECLVQVCKIYLKDHSEDKLLEAPTVILDLSKMRGRHPSQTHHHRLKGLMKKETQRKKQSSELLPIGGVEEES